MAKTLGGDIGTCLKERHVRHRPNPRAEEFCVSCVCTHTFALQTGELLIMTTIINSVASRSADDEPHPAYVMQSQFIKLGLEQRAAENQLKESEGKIKELEGELEHLRRSHEDLLGELRSKKREREEIFTLETIASQLCNEAKKHMRGSGGASSSA